MGRTRDVALLAAGAAFATRERAAPSHTSVTVNRQSVADDARLLNEVQNEAESRIQAVYVHNIKAANMQAIETVACQDVANWCIVRHLRFTINGQEYKRKLQFDNQELVRTPATAEIVAKAVAEALTEWIMNDVIETETRQRV